MCAFFVRGLLFSIAHSFCAGLEQKLGTGLTFEGERIRKRGVAAVVALVHIRPGGDKLLQKGGIALLGGEDEGGVAILICGIQVHPFRVHE